MVNEIVYAACAAKLGLIAAVFFLVFGLRQDGLDQTLPVLAEVIEVWIKVELVSTKADPLRVVERPWVTLRATPVNGEAVTFGLTPSPKTLVTLKVGQRVPLRFNPQNPLASVLDADSLADKPGIARGGGIAALAFFAASPAVVLWGRFRTRQYLWLRHHGEEREAVVIGYKKLVFPNMRFGPSFRVIWKDERDIVGPKFSAAHAIRRNPWRPAANRLKAAGLCRSEGPFKFGLDRRCRHAAICGLTCYTARSILVLRWIRLSDE